MAEPLRLRPIKNADIALQPGFSQSACNRIIASEVQQECLLATVVTKVLNTSRKRSLDFLDLRLSALVRGASHLSRVGAKTEQGHSVAEPLAA